jgi:hypothetical protein
VYCGPEKHAALPTSVAYVPNHTTDVNKALDLEWRIFIEV